MRAKKLVYLIGTIATAALLMGAAVDTDGNAVTPTTDIGDIDGDATTVQDLKDVIAPGVGIFYATCATGSSQAAKVASTARYAADSRDNDFVLTNGTIVVVKFSSANTAATPTLAVNGTGARNIRRHGTTSSFGTSSPSNAWYANEAVMFVYDGTQWLMLKHPYASTSYPGVVVLNSSTNSTSTAHAATPSAVKDVRTYVDTAVATKVGSDAVTNLVWEIYLTSQRYIYDSETETTYRFNSQNDFLTLTAVTNVPPTREVIEALERIH